MFTIQSLFQSLREQHVIDLHIYRAHHTNLANRILHWILIPVETAAFWWWIASGWSLSRRCARRPLVPFILYGTGLLALGMAPPQPYGVAVVSCLWHVALGRWIQQQQQTQWWGTPPTVKTNLSRAAVAWIIAWTVQVGIGHGLLEQNQPNVANMEDVSWLAMILSVLIAWSS